MTDVVLYARLSVTTEESVSIARQLEAGRQYAAARGWTVAAEFTDDGVSASKVRPDARPGWRALLAETGQRRASGAPIHAALAWKIDRLARRLGDFTAANDALAELGVGLVVVDDSLDMTTDTGRMVAQILAVFAEFEARQIASRVRAARTALLMAGRRSGGRPPYGWRNVPNPAGPGMVLAQDPERIGYVAEAAQRILDGHSVYGVARWLERKGVTPRTRVGRKDENRWHDASVESILRAPALAGLTAFGGDVLRDEDGLPVVDESVAVLTTKERRRLLAKLDEGKRPGTRQKSGAEPALLYGLIRCGSCEGLMYRATAAKKYLQYRCQQNGCLRPVGIARDAVENYVVSEVLARAGDKPVITVVEVERDNTPLLADIEAAIRDTTAAMATDEADMDGLSKRLGSLKDARTAARAGGGAPQVRVSGETLNNKWAAAAGVEERRRLLLGQLEAVRISVGGGRGRAFDPSRVDLQLRRLNPVEQQRLQELDDLLHMRHWQKRPRG